MPFASCGKIFTCGSKLRRALAKSYEKTGTPVAVQVQHAPSAEKPQRGLKPSTPVTTTSFADHQYRYVCPYEGCNKAYIQSYKLGHVKLRSLTRSGEKTNPNRSKMNPVHKVHSYKVYNSKISRLMPLTSVVSGTSSQVKQSMKIVKTEEDGGNNIEDGWRFDDNDEDEKHQMGIDEVGGYPSVSAKSKSMQSISSFNIR